MAEVVPHIPAAAVDGRRLHVHTTCCVLFGAARCSIWGALPPPLPRGSSFRKKWKREMLSVTDLE